MAFCNSCGATLDTGAKFCNKCGATQPTAPAAPVATASPAPTSGQPAKSGSALKIILIVVAIIVGLGILGVGTAAYFAHRAYVKIKDAAENTQVEEHNGKVRIKSPVLNMETSTDAEEAARNIGIDPYPGAETVKDGSSSATMGNVSTVSVQLVTDDAPSTVADYYKSKLSNVSFSSNQGDQYTMMANEPGGMVTVTIAPEMGRTHIVISKVSKK